MALPLLAALAPSIISGVASFFGGKKRNEASAAEAKRNREFQERMSSTAHQREIVDLRKAGLNPILSATGGRGASSPGGSMAQFQDIATPAVASALSARRMGQEIRNLRATEGLTIAQTAVQRQQESLLKGPAGVGDWLGEAIESLNELRSQAAGGPSAVAARRNIAELLEGLQKLRARGGDRSLAELRAERAKTFPLKTRSGVRVIGRTERTSFPGRR